MFVVAAVLLVCFAIKPSQRRGLAWLLWATLGGAAASLIAACLGWPQQGEATLTFLARTFLPEAYVLNLTWLITGPLRTAWATLPGILVATAIIAARRMRRDGHTRCGACGHILKGLREPRCGECGRRI
jgi:hypothetical protein